MPGFKLIPALSIIILCFFINQYLFGQNDVTRLEIDSVSVIDTTGHVIISWTLDMDITSGHFKIHRQMDDLTYDVIETIDSLDSDHYIDSTVNAAEKAQSYYISVHRDDGQSLARSKAHQTIFIKDISYNICTEKATIMWSNYIVTEPVGMPDTLNIPFESTMILSSIDNNGFEQLSELSSDSNNVTLPVDKTGKYCFIVRSSDPDNKSHTSSSNIKCTNVKKLRKPEFAYLRKASAISNEFIELSLYADSKVSHPSYIIYRSENWSGIYESADTIKSNEAEIMYNDNVNPELAGYRYYFEVIDSCMRSVKKSNIVKPVHLNAKPLSFNENHLEWNKPGGLKAGVESYHILRKNPDDNTFDRIASPNESQTSYTDYIPRKSSSVDVAPQEFSYIVKAVEAHGNPYEFRDTVFSNEAVAERDIEIFIPNAFRPTSSIEENQVFKPIISNAIIEQYGLIIYNTWGEKVFRATDPDDSWDGYIGGDIAPTGVYRYTITLKTNDGKEHNKRGTVTLVR